MPRRYGSYPLDQADLQRKGIDRLIGLKNSLRSRRTLQVKRRFRNAVRPAPREIVMQRVKHPPVRNKIDLADPSQVRAWARRLDVTTDTLKAVISKVGASVVTVTKEIELQRSGPLDPVQGADAEGKSAVQV
jgi:hypothetical protein